MHNIADVYGAVGAMVHFRGIWQEAQRMMDKGNPLHRPAWRAVRDLAERRIAAPEAEMREYLEDPDYHFPRVERT